MTDGDVLTVTDTEVRRTRPDGTDESVAWADLTEVLVVTTDEGAFGNDLILLLLGTGASGVAVPADTDGYPALLQRLLRLPGFDRPAYDVASGSTANATFPVWRRSP
jgi:hypothetical protein